MDLLKTFYNIKDNEICLERSGMEMHIWVKLRDMTTLKRAYELKMDIVDNLTRHSEKRFQDYLEARGYPYIYIDQTIESFSKFFKDIAKRPDFLI